MENNIKLLIPPDEIQNIVQRVADEIRSDFASRKPVLIGALKGAFVFLSDLVRAIETPLEVDFVQTASYGDSDTPAPEVLIISDITTDIRGRDVIIVEGIIDRGHTARALVKHLEAKGPSSIRVCTLLLRNGSSVGTKIDYIGRYIDEGFVVGYGMDYREDYRSLPGLYLLNRPQETKRPP